MLVTLGIVAAFALHQRGRSALGGIALALVTCIKYYPGAFVVYFLICRDRRFLAAFGVGLLGFYCLLPAALLGVGDWWYFERASAQSLPEAARLLRDFNTQYFVHVLNRWGQPLGYRLGESTLDVLRLVGVLVFCANSVVVWWLHKRKIAHREGAIRVVVISRLAVCWCRLRGPITSSSCPFAKRALWRGVWRGPSALAVASTGCVLGGAGEWVLLCLVPKLAVVQWDRCAVRSQCGPVVCALRFGPYGEGCASDSSIAATGDLRRLRACTAGRSWSVPGGRGCGVRFYLH